ncbi:ligase-associated DNA damage response endonuclease PdeM [Ruegeria sp. 2205SS24-7]|uniref:ligase-associated DNA damage response endonuclease PdeM n=1 Tax=Ruegeria discodermiae TaxID=3064389 RepID=UPI0027415638|nr:ligase-associated DNA damage response endonuclease PdeM [Ruegeria sp. 2205SS24-7]MDP5220544.1 ligase-associated DNA damage response endonuclease PdeM [Ruegeria sp. 2205SS24-7]
MNGFEFEFAGKQLVALGSGALWWPDWRLLCVSDLHLGKSERIARRGAPALPPYETRDTLNRLADDLDQTGARIVICLGDSFDDLDAARALGEGDRQWIASLQAGRDWTWIEGNHDPGPVEIGGQHRHELRIDTVTFRHIAAAGAVGEISGHFHPKARIRTRGRSITRAAFLVDRDRLLLPAYGTYTGGLHCDDPVLCDLMRPDALAILTGSPPRAVPMPRDS